jgi:hypothetical protein
MPKAFSLLSWNVEHFKQDPARLPRIVAMLGANDPDVFGLYEVEGKEVFGALSAAMPGYSFHITEGPQVQEILVGVRGGLTAFFTQKVQFRSGVSLLRPGALLTLTIDSQSYPLLFLHTASGDDPRGLGLRDDMLLRACQFRKTLDGAPAGAGRANYLFLGDLNTMGMQYRYVPGHNLETAHELAKLTKEAGKVKMRLLTKDEPSTWSNGSGSATPPSNLDHVVAAEHLTFRQFGGCDVTVKGWPKEATAAARDQWINEYSDHGFLYLEVQKVA